MRNISELDQCSRTQQPAERIYWLLLQAAKRYGELFSDSKTQITAFVGWKVFTRMVKWERAEAFCGKKMAIRWKPYTPVSTLEPQELTIANFPFGAIFQAL